MFKSVINWSFPKCLRFLNITSFSIGEAPSPPKKNEKNNIIIIINEKGLSEYILMLLFVITEDSSFSSKRNLKVWRPLKMKALGEYI